MWQGVTEKMLLCGRMGRSLVEMQAEHVAGVGRGACKCLQRKRGCGGGADREEVQPVHDD